MALLGLCAQGLELVDLLRIQLPECSMSLGQTEEHPGSPLDITKRGVGLHAAGADERTQPISAQLGC